MAGNAGLALGVQATGPEQGDRVVLVVVHPWAGVRSWSGGCGASIGEAGRPGVLHKLLALSGAR
jgi:hypothetical protein